MPRMVEVVIDSVRVSLTNQQRIVVLREINTERYLPIWIGPYEAEAITIALQEIEVARPQTHDLLRNILKNLNAQLVRVEVLALREDVFYGNLVVEAENQTINIDSRPSDALALAVRTHVPILIASEVMDAAGVIPEQDIESSDSDTQRAAATDLASEEGGEDRLSIFEDFLSNINMDDLSQSSDDDDEEPDEGGTEPEK
ncbi:MAG TPA: bifunctional nuclease family protein [Longilinea sp.]|nr:bifunctional nuclease family protein [Longilinea sp.]